jgi:hypothetical protein
VGAYRCRPGSQRCHAKSDPRLKINVTIFTFAAPCGGLSLRGAIRGLNST